MSWEVRMSWEAWIFWEMRMFWMRWLANFTLVTHSPLSAPLYNTGPSPLAFRRSFDSRPWTFARFPNFGLRPSVFGFLLRLPLLPGRRGPGRGGLLWERRPFETVIERSLDLSMAMRRGDEPIAPLPSPLP